MARNRIVGRPDTAGSTQLVEIYRLVKFQLMTTQSGRVMKFLSQRLFPGLKTGSGILTHFPENRGILPKFSRPAQGRKTGVIYFGTRASGQTGGGCTIWRVWRADPTFLSIFGQLLWHFYAQKAATLCRPGRDPGFGGQRDPRFWGHDPRIWGHHFVQKGQSGKNVMENVTNKS